MLRSTIFLLAFTALLHAGEEDVTFRSDVSLIRVDAQVVDRSNRAIAGLRMEDFVLTEEGKRQEIRNFAAENMPIDVLFLLDVSGSMRPHVQRIANAAHEALLVLGPKDRVAVMVFDRQTRLRMPFRTGRGEAERGFEDVLNQESFNGGTDITRGMLDAANYIRREGRTDARRAIVILTDDETEFDRNDAGVNRALVRADTVLSALIAPGMGSRQGGYGGGYPTGGNRRGGYGGGGMGGGNWPLDPSIIFGGPRQQGPYGGRGGGIPGMGGGRIGGRTSSAGTAEIARASGGDSMNVDDASALEDTLSRLRQRYALHFYLPAGVKPGQERNIEVALAASAARRYPDAEVRFRRTYLSPNGTAGDEPTVVSSTSRSDAASAPADSDTEDRPRIQRRRPMVDRSSSSPDSVDLSPVPQADSKSDSKEGGWRKTNGADADAEDARPRITRRPMTDNSSGTPAVAEPAEQPKEGGWRKLKPGEKP